jgi:hypothetical protein
MASDGTTTAMRESSLTINDKAFRMKYVQVLLMCGIPLDNTNGVLRKFVEGIYKLPSESVEKLKPIYIKMLFKLEKERTAPRARCSLSSNLTRRSKI